MLIELSSWLFIYTFKQWKWFVIGASCFRVRVLCAVISVKSLSTKFIWTTEKLSDWWFKIFVMRWYYWRSKRQHESWVGDKFVLSTKLISFWRWESQWICIWLVGWRLRYREYFGLVYSTVTRRYQSIAKVANVVVKISQIVEGNRLRPDRHRLAQHIRSKGMNTTVPWFKYATDVLVNSR